MNINEEIKELRCRLDKLEQEVTSENHDYELYLKIDDHNNLNIIFDEEGGFKILGIINSDGQLKVISTLATRTNYKNWVSQGQKIRENNEVEWRGKKYCIVENTYLKNVYQDCYIYDFRYAKPCTRCIDDNIVRYEHNNTPILF